MSSTESILPRLRKEEIKIWDDDLNICGGYLNKKAGKQSAFNKGKWQKRWFFIKLDLASKDTYVLEYSHSPEDKSTKLFPLEGASVVISTGNSFQLTLPEESETACLIASAELPEVRDAWVQTLDRAIFISNLRGRMIKERELVLNEPENGDLSAGDYDFPVEKMNAPFHIRHKINPQLRIDVDINSIPPSSMQRRQFVEMFIGDVAQALQIPVQSVEVISLKPALGMDWLTVVEFDLIDLLDNVSEGESRVGCDDSVQVFNRQELLHCLHQYVTDPNSLLYNGFITCKLDSSYCIGILEDTTREDLELYSSDPKVFAVLNRYKDIALPLNHLDTSHFHIAVEFDGRSALIDVPNPMVFPRRRHCAIWPFEIKQKLGLWGTMQELWVEPTRLIPKGMPKYLSQPILFQPSARLGGAVAINSSLLKADMIYELDCEDYRTAVEESLTEEERLQIRATFDSYDKNGDGSVSKTELELLVRQRIQERKAIIEEKFIEVVNSGVTPEEMQQAEESKRQHLQHLDESQAKLVKMFDAADLNQDGTLSFEEFLLAEAWWMHCTLNPDCAHLF